jgi:hypothetical protein
MYLEEHWLRQQWYRRSHRGIKPLQMAGLGNAPVLARYIDQFVGFGDSCGERLLDQDIDTTLHQLPGDCEMRNGGNGYRCSLHSGCDQIVYGAKGLGPEFIRDSLRPRKIDVRDPYQLDVMGGICLQVAIDTRVIAAKSATADDSDA